MDGPENKLPHPDYSPMRNPRAEQAVDVQLLMCMKGHCRVGDPTSLGVEFWLVSRAGNHGAILSS